MREKEREFCYTMDDFNFLRGLSSSHSGIIVTDDKFNMFYSRIVRRIRALQLKTVKEYCEYLQRYKQTEFDIFINAITTNLTSFFREKHHFEYLEKTLIPELLNQNKNLKQITVWSAGCSSGEEAYSIAMVLLENIPYDWTIKILATDLDSNVLASAKAGIYTIERVSDLPPKRLKRWFQKGRGEQLDKVKVKQLLRDSVSFKQLNLMDEWPITIKFDFIFCRNVLIYFDKETKNTLVSRYADCLKMNAHLFIGHSESLHKLETNFTLIGNTIYRKGS